MSSSQGETFSETVSPTPGDERYTMPTTLVVGAGLAGLVVAYRLHQAGASVDIIEARDRPCGRIHSLPNALGTGITAEMGGEVFNSDHAACLTLAKSLGLAVVDLWDATATTGGDTFFFHGDRLNGAALMAEFTTLLQAQAQDWQAVQSFMHTATVTAAIAALDAQPIPDYLAKIGASAQLVQVVSAAYTIKYGMDAAEQSCLNLLNFFRCDRDCQDLWGTSDERFYLQGGNQQLPSALAAAVAPRLELETALEALAETADGRYQVTLCQGTTRRDRTYDRVVLAIPFRVLRQIPLRVALPDRQRQAIQHLGYNSPTKFFTAYRTKLWHQHQSNGQVFTDLPIQHCWEAGDSLFSPAQGLLVSYPGGAGGQALAQQDLAIARQQVVQQLDHIFPGLAAVQASADCLRSPWLSDPYSQGAYSCYRVGQWSAFYGCEGDRVGNLFFAGEHCSRYYQGYMEGACETGEQVAWEILHDLGLTAAAQAQRSRLDAIAAMRAKGFSGRDREASKE